MLLFKLLARITLVGGQRVRAERWPITRSCRQVDSCSACAHSLRSAVRIAVRFPRRWPSRSTAYGICSGLPKINEQRLDSLIMPTSCWSEGGSILPTPSSSTCVAMASRFTRSSSSMCLKAASSGLTCPNTANTSPAWSHDLPSSSVNATFDDAPGRLNGVALHHPLGALLIPIARDRFAQFNVIG